MKDDERAEWWREAWRTVFGFIGVLILCAVLIYYISSSLAGKH